MNKLKIENQFYLDGVVSIFHNESNIVKILNEIKLLISKIILIAVIYALGFILLNKLEVLKIIYSIGGCILIVIYLFYEITKIFKSVCSICNKKYMFKLSDITKILAELRRKELKILKKILIKNNLYYIDLMDQMTNYYGEKKNFDDTNLGQSIAKILGTFLTIIFGVLGIYTSIYSFCSVDEMLLNILKISKNGLVICILFCTVYIIYRIKNYSILYLYTYNKLYKLLIELSINKKVISNKRSRHNNLKTRFDVKEKV